MTAKADVLNNMVGLGEEFLAKENFASRQILFACEKLLHAGAIPDPATTLNVSTTVGYTERKSRKIRPLRLYFAAYFGNFASNSAKVFRQNSVT
jgi:hypothetical protein